MKTKRIITIGDSEYHYSFSYFTSNKWADNDTFVRGRSKHPEIGFRSYPYEYERELVKISLTTGEITPLCNDVLKYEDHLVSAYYK